MPIFRGAVAIVVVSAAVFAALAVPAQAQASKLPFTFQNAFDTVLDPGSERITPGGILSVRDRVLSGSQTMTIEGEAFSTDDVVLTLNVNLDLRTGRGTVFGTYVLETEFDTWTGIFRGVIDPATGRSSGSFRGDGAVSKQQPTTFVERTVQGAIVAFEGEGVILVPADRD